MTFKSHRQPLCRACGKKIKKWTHDVYVYATPPKTHDRDGNRMHVPRHVVGQPRTKAEAQKLVNEKVISVRRSLDNSVIHHIGVWDGETYKDQFFCKGTCAASYAYMMAAVEGTRHGIMSVAYADGLRREREGKEPK